MKMISRMNSGRMGGVQELIGIGPALKKAREELGFSLEEMQKKTNIQADHLRSLEEERFEQLPSPFYTRGFLRAYAKSLRLNWRHLLDLYEKTQNEHAMDPEKNTPNLVVSTNLPSTLAHPPTRTKQSSTNHRLISEIETFAPRREALKAKKRKRKKKRIWWMALAASLILFTLVAYMIFSYN